MSEPILKTPLHFHPEDMSLRDRTGKLLGDFECFYRQNDESRGILAAIVSACNFDLDAFALELNRRIMNAPLDDAALAKALAMYDNPKIIYKVGHKDMRHAAAELVLKLVSEMQEVQGG